MSPYERRKQILEVTGTPLESKGGFVRLEFPDGLVIRGKTSNVAKYLDQVFYQLTTCKMKSITYKWIKDLRKKKGRGLTLEELKKINIKIKEV